MNNEDATVKFIYSQGDFLTFTDTKMVDARIEVGTF